MFEEIRKELIEMEDKENAKFEAKLCPETDIKEILGIKIPKLRKKAKEIVINKPVEQFLKECRECKEPKYLEEVIIEGLVIAYSKLSLKEKLEYMKLFIPQITNWLINDTVCSTLKVKKEEEQEILWNFIVPYLKSQNQFEVRFAVVMMLDNFIVENYADKVIKELDRISNKEYYSEMAIAWTLAEIGIKFNDKLMNYLKGNNNLDKFTFNKTLQKMRESYRISKEQKEELKAMKRM